MTPRVTLLYAALPVLLNVALAFNVTRLGWRENVGLLDGMPFAGSTLAYASLAAMGGVGVALRVSH